MSGVPVPQVFEELAKQLEAAHTFQTAHFIDVIPAVNRYETDAKPVRDITGIGNTYADRLTNAGITDTHILADTPTTELATVTETTEQQAEKWVSQVPEATIYDNDDVWMTVMVIPGGTDIDTIMAFVDSITGMNKPFNGDTVRFYLGSDDPEPEAKKTNPETLHAKEIDVITTGIQKHFDMPISGTPYAQVL